MRDNSGNWQASYSTGLGKESAKSYAIQCAVRIKGGVFFADENGKETQVFDLNAKQNAPNH